MHTFAAFSYSPASDFPSARGKFFQSKISRKAAFAKHNLFASCQSPLPSRTGVADAAARTVLCEGCAPTQWEAHERPELPIVPRGPQAGGAGVFPAKLTVPTRAFFAEHALLEKERIVPHCFSREQGGKKHVECPQIWPIARSQTSFAYIWPPRLLPKGQKSAFSQRELESRARRPSRSTISLQASTVPNYSTMQLPFSQQIASPTISHVLFDPHSNYFSHVPARWTSLLLFFPFVCFVHFVFKLLDLAKISYGLAQGGRHLAPHHYETIRLPNYPAFPCS